MGNNGVNTRALALDILLMQEKGEDKSHNLLKAVLDKYDYLSSSDKGFIKRLVEGTTEYKLRLDYVINTYSKTPVNKLKPVIRQIMRMSIYQIMYMDRVPDSAVCNEAVKLTAARGLSGLKGFVNGVLRTVIREADTIKWPDEKQDMYKALSVNYSCPEHIVRSLVSDYGYDIALNCLKESLSDERGTYVRIDESLSEDKIIKIINEISDGKTSSEISVSGQPEITKLTGKIDYAVSTLEPDKVMRMQEFKDGLITIQDISSMCVCEAAEFDRLAGVKGIKVLDMCASPGGKSMHAAAKLKRYKIDGHILSLDVSENKLYTINENISRMNLNDYIESGIWDATVFNEEYEDSFDVVIADIPCSGLGVIGRKPDIKYNVTPDSMNEIVTLQRKILDNAVRYVRPGGRLIFSTCTMCKNENEGAKDYIINKGGYKLITSGQMFISKANDGFYIAAFDRN